VTNAAAQTRFGHEGHTGAGEACPGREPVRSSSILEFSNLIGHSFGIGPILEFSNLIGHSFGIGSIPEFADLIGYSFGVRPIPEVAYFIDDPA